MSTATEIPISYGRLIRRFVLRPIRSKKDYDRASTILDELAVRDESSLDPGETDYLETLTLLIDAYDREHYPMPMKGASPLDTLRFLVSQNQVKQTELAKVLGIGPSAVSMVLSGTRPITADHARRLGDRFGVDPGLFV
jgi:HTH-type transcriptional regulator / antitoxin HigA